MSIQWLLNKGILQKVKNDPNYRYEMLYSEFMSLYRHYASGHTEPAQIVTHEKPSAPMFDDSAASDFDSGSGEILSQDEIDNLVDSLK